ncbi:GntR family transcriptional regulator [uncultured Paracoccus sp.]|uniref:GntR family transcriptional regulator n=1 Tax=uncultured Paracoccus sp. TaxID=189685 RepID=UPI00263308B6|nr:GntR family transcriptional regulator [uncultured Paracoccus sp.]
MTGRAGRGDSSRGRETATTYPGTIAAQLRREILTGVLPPGSPIKERDHAERLGVSRTPLREAVRMLAKEGLVTLRPLRSPTVIDMTLDEALDEVAVLRQLELFGGELACRNATPEEIVAIRRLCETIEADHASGDKVEVFDADMQMHRAIVAASHNPALTRTHGEYLSRLWRIRFLSARERTDAMRVLADHRGIVRALESRDAAAMRRHMESHLDGLVRNLTRQMSPAEETDQPRG